MGDQYVVSALGKLTMDVLRTHAKDENIKVGWNKAVLVYRLAVEMQKSALEKLMGALG